MKRAFLLAIAFLVSAAVASAAEEVESQFPSYWQIPNGITLMFGVPHGFELAYDRRVSELFSFGASVGGLTIPLKGSSGLTYKIGTTNIDFNARWHPFSGGFFLGMLLGVEDLSGEADGLFVIPGSPPTNISATAKLSVVSISLTPHLGWYWVFGRGFTMGLEGGVQIPFAPKSKFDTAINQPALQSYLSQLETLPQYQQLQSDIQSAGDKIGRVAFPYVAIRTGWSF